MDTDNAFQTADGSDQTPTSGNPAPPSISKDLVSGVVVFLVALPLCLGIALASGAPLISGLLAGIIGGLVVAAISGSHTSVSGPAAGLTAIVAAQIEALGSFEAFLVAVALGGVIQIGFGIAKAGALSAFFPSSVIKGLLAAIGVILILKQIPHVVGHDSDPEGDMAYNQVDGENTFSELVSTLTDIHMGAAVVGIASIIMLVLWGKSRLSKSIVPAPLVVVIFGVFAKLAFDALGGVWLIGESHLVQVPVASSPSEFIGFFQTPDFSALGSVTVYIGAITIAIVASLETLLNLEAVDKLDVYKRNSPASRELVAQGVGNLVGGLIGALPVTSVIVRSSVNVASGARSKLSAIFHGVLLVVCVGVFPGYLNLIPLSALAAILLVTGFKLASPKLFKQMWSEGKYQFAPFIITLVSIVMTDLLLGILIGLGVSVLFILNSNLRQPIRRIVETHVGGEVTHLELSNQVSFLNRAALDRQFNLAKPGARMVIDASQTDYIDPDVLSLIREYKQTIAPARGVDVSLRGFKSKYQLRDDVVFADYTTREQLDQLGPDDVLEILKEGNRRFRSDNRLTRDLSTQVTQTAEAESPMAVILSGIDSRVPAELIFDCGLGDLLSVRVAGNVIGDKTLASCEYGLAVAGAKLLVILGHTRCGTVKLAVEMVADHQDVSQATGCDNLSAVTDAINPAIDPSDLSELQTTDDPDVIIDRVASRNVQHSIEEILLHSRKLRELVESGEIAIVGAMYDVRSGRIEFLEDSLTTNANQP
ncbi:MAG: SulP family inorganic anion transporter [Planctomycetota bacterium]